VAGAAVTKLPYLDAGFFCGIQKTIPHPQATEKLVADPSFISNPWRLRNTCTANGGLGACLSD